MDCIVSVVLCVPCHVFSVVLDVVQAKPHLSTNSPGFVSGGPRRQHRIKKERVEMAGRCVLLNTSQVHRPVLVRATAHPDRECLKFSKTKQNQQKTKIKNNLDSAKVAAIGGLLVFHAKEIPQKAPGDLKHPEHKHEQVGWKNGAKRDER
jgi:hypothetical protein